MAAAGEPMALSASGLRKRYGSVTALDGVALTVARGELVGLLGPNGAGKSTLVKIACGLVAPTGGTAHVFGAPAGSRAARGSLGYLAELFRFPDWCTALEVLRLHQQLAGSTGGHDERLRLLALVGLADAATRRVGLLATIGAALGAHAVQTIAHDLAIALPFEGLYQAGLHALGSNESELTGVLVNLGPFGSSHAGGSLLDAWAVVYVAIVAGLAGAGFARRDL